jgi:hypothetical protein
MKIDRSTAVSQPAITTEAKSRPVTPSSSQALVSGGGNARRDSVEISAEARELAALDADRAERILIVQARIKQEYYSSPVIQRDVARRVLTSGDV